MRWRLLPAWRLFTQTKLEITGASIMEQGRIHGSINRGQEQKTSKNNFMTNRPTNGPTDQKVAYRVACL